MLIAQISDMHLKPEGVLAYEVADTVRPFERVVEHINLLNPRPDLVLVTGDLVDEGAEESYMLLKSLLSPLKPPVLLLPGNHDQKQRLRKCFPEDKYIRESVEEDGKSYICYTVEDYFLRLIGLDTVTPGEHGGGLGSERIGWLNRVLEEQPEKPTIIFMHHPPFATGIGHMDEEEFKGHKELQSVIEKHPQVERMLCGHVHRPIYRRFGGTLATICPAVSMQIVLDLCPNAPSAFVMEPPAVMLHLWTDLWGEPTLLTHISIVEETPGQYGGPHPFFGVVSPK